MGNFEPYALQRRDVPTARSVLRHDVGPHGTNAPEDLHIIARALAGVGLLDETACPDRTHRVIFNAIRHMRQTLALPGADRTSDAQITPGDITERTVRRALVQGRLSLSHRTVAESTAPKGARSVIDAGMRRARAKLEEFENTPPLGTPERRALLPSVSPETFQSNRRLADAIAAGGELPGLEHVIAATIRDGGKQGYSDVRDFMSVLRSRAPNHVDPLCGRIAANLKNKPLRRYRKLRSGQTPTEGDFDDPPAP